MSVNPPIARTANVGDRLLRAGRAFSERLIGELQANGFPDARVAHSNVFPHIERNGSRIVDLAARAGMTKQSMGELVDDLERLGYVERRPDPSDRRARLVVLTASGRRQARTALRIIDRMERGFRERLGADRYSTLLEALEEIAGSAERATPGGP